MRPYDVEFFSAGLKFKSNTNIADFTYKEDYLSPETNEITILAMAGLEEHDILRISGNGRDISGTVSAVATVSDGLMKISYKPLITMLDTGFPFPVDKQRTGTLEGFLKETIESLFVNNPDAAQNIPGLEVEAVTETPDWYFHITPSHKGGHYNAVELMKSVFIPAFEKYRVALRCGFDPGARKIRVRIGKPAGPPKTIEADLPNVIDKNIVIAKVNVSQNKVIIYDAATDYADTRTYYLHPDLSYSQNDTDRMTPVVCKVRVVESSEESSFKSLAEDTASDVFANVRHNNLIELECLAEDGLINPMGMEIGKEADVISGGNTYRTMLTGREISDTVKLTFGVVRLDLTKLIEKSVKEETASATPASTGSGTYVINKVSFSDLTPEQRQSLKGDVGAKGEKGDTGAKGEKGDPGAKGADGSKIAMTAATLLSSGWNNKVYSFEGQYPAANYDLEVAPDGDTITAGQLEAWSAAQIIGSGTANQIKAMGTQPRVDIPVIVKAVTK